jgi:hypothetical protein
MTHDELTRDQNKIVARSADLELAFAGLYRFVDQLPTAMQDLVTPREWQAICRLQGHRVDRKCKCGKAIHMTPEFVGNSETTIERWYGDDDGTAFCAQPSTNGRAPQRHEPV